MSEKEQILVIEELARQNESPLIPEGEKLKNDIISLEMQLNTFIKSQREESQNLKRKMKKNGHIWRGSRNFDGKNYADKIVKKHETMEKLKARYLKQKKSSSNLKGQNINNMPLSNISNMKKTQVTVDYIEKKNLCCYHCYRLFKEDFLTEKLEGESFCGVKCLNKYKMSLMKQCSKCNQKYLKEKCRRENGWWFCQDCV